MEVSQSFADNCKRATCTCSTHSDYTEVARERLSSASEDKVTNFDNGLAETVAETPSVLPAGNGEESTDGQSSEPSGESLSDSEGNSN